MRDYTNQNADVWYEELLNQMEKFPFSFSYEGERICGFSEKYFSIKDQCREKINDKETVTFVYDFRDDLEVKLLLAHYFSHGVTEWTIWFENKGERNSGVLADLKTVLNLCGERPVLSGNLGDHDNKYRAYEYDLSDAPVDFVTDSGRATHGNFPYFNLEYGDGGACLAIGWAGTWSAAFTADKEKITYTAKAVNNLSTYLKPGEVIRTALFVYAPYTKRDRDFAANYWRDWFIKYNLPKADKEKHDLQPLSAVCLACDTGKDNEDGSVSESYETWKPSLTKMLEEDIHVDFRWFDAGWYIRPDQTSVGKYVERRDWWDSVGTWEYDPVKWPDGNIREATDFARAHGMKTLQWFEPERVTDVENMIARYGYKKEWALFSDECEVLYWNRDDNVINNIGDEECLRWTVNKVCSALKNSKIELYREDVNCDAGPLWRWKDEQEGENRHGITENKFIQGHYKMWDEIIQCTLSLGGCGFVDSCASGGGRNDLESMRRGVPLMRSDGDRTTTSLRLSMSSTFNKWIPFHGAYTRESVHEADPSGGRDMYVWRASYLPVVTIDAHFVQNPNEDFEIIRKGLKEWRKVNPYLLKEFYVHTPWHSEHEKTSFTAFSYYDDEKSEGVIFGFRQEECQEDTLEIKLSYVEADKHYCLINEDTGEKETYSGEELKKGIRLFFEKPRTACLIWIKSVS